MREIPGMWTVLSTESVRLKLKGLKEHQEESRTWLWPFPKHPPFKRMSLPAGTLTQMATSFQRSRKVSRPYDPVNETLATFKASLLMLISTQATVKRQRGGMKEEKKWWNVPPEVLRVPMHNVLLQCLNAQDVRNTDVNGSVKLK